MPDAGRHDRPPVRHGRTVGRPALLGALVTAVYRFEFEPTEEGGAGRLAGTVEGAAAGVLAEVGVRGLLGPERRHNPDRAGPPVRGVRPDGYARPADRRRDGERSLACNCGTGPPWSWRRRPPRSGSRWACSPRPGPSRRSTSPAVIVQVPIVGPQNVPIQVVVPGPGIASLAIECQADEHLLIELCVEQGPARED